MRCVWCDSEYTFTGGEHVSLEDILIQVRAFGCQLVEVTGGDPLAQKEAYSLIKKLCDEDFEVLIETGGFFSTEGVDERAAIILDVKCPASGEAARNHWPNLDRLRADRDEIKFVIANRADWDYAVDVIKRHELEHRTRAILISPAWNEIDLKDLADWVATSALKVRMQLQLHKYIWGPNVRGV
jgi:7-carboxy-7-deazaguanine synthase